MIKWIFEVRNNSEVFIWKVIGINSVYYDGAWKHGQESDERAPALSLQVVDFIINSLIFMLLIFHVILLKKTYKNKYMLCSFMSCRTFKYCSCTVLKLFFAELKYYDFILKIELRGHT